MLLSVLLGLCVAIMIFGVVILIKNEVTFRNRTIISQAIFLYEMDAIINNRVPALGFGYDDRESYEATLYRLWDWGYTRILPPDKFEIIKPYVEKVLTNKNKK